MSFSGTGTNQRQHGVLRIEIAAIVTLFAAFAIVVLFTHLSPAHQLSVVQTVRPAQVPPARNVGAVTLAVPLLLPAVDREPDAP